MSEKTASMHDAFMVVSIITLVTGLGLFAKFVLV